MTRPTAFSEDAITPITLNERSRVTIDDVEWIVKRRPVAWLGRSVCRLAPKELASHRRPSPIKVRDDSGAR
jgi:hypothetical protein